MGDAEYNTVCGLTCGLKLLVYAALSAGKEGGKGRRKQAMRSMRPYATSVQGLKLQSV